MMGVHGEQKEFTALQRRSGRHSALGLYMQEYTCTLQYYRKPGNTAGIYCHILLYSTVNLEYIER
jgi:hypothetical protein